jgi:hypothetical protein
MAPYRTGRTTRCIDEHRVGASRPERRRLKIGGNAPNRHSRAAGRIGKTTHALVPGVTRQNPRAPGFEGDGFAAWRCAGVVDHFSGRDSCVGGHKRMGGVLDDESAFRVAWKVSGYRGPAIGYRVKANARVKRSDLGPETCFVESIKQRVLIPPRGLDEQLRLPVIPFY